MLTAIKTIFQVKPPIDPETMPLLLPQTSEQTAIYDRALSLPQKETTCGRTRRRTLFKTIDLVLDRKRHQEKFEDKEKISLLFQKTLDAVQNNDPQQVMNRMKELFDMDIFKSLNGLPNSDAKQRLKWEVTNASQSLMNNPFDNDVEFYERAQQAKEMLGAIDRPMLKQRRSAQTFALMVIESAFPHVANKDKAAIVKNLTTILPHLEYSAKPKVDAQRQGVELLEKMLLDLKDDGDRMALIQDLEVAVGTFSIRKHGRTMSRIFDLSNAEKRTKK